MRKRKHSIVVEITVSHPLTESDAVRGFQLLVDERLDLDARPVWATKPVYVDKLRAKRFSRVCSALGLRAG